jgi:HAD superfamily hydrolase (TIGR01509 family)
MWSAALLDLDGTLLDYSSAQAGAAAEASRGLGASPEELLAFVRSEPVQSLESCRPCDRDPASVYPGSSDECAVFLERFFEALSMSAGTIPGAAALLRGLREAGVLTAAVSNGIGWVQRRRLERAGLVHLFDALVISCEVGTCKPRPEIFRTALALLGTGAGSAVMIGDSPGSDMAGAGPAGLDFIYFRPDGDFSAPGPRVAEARTLEEVSSLLRNRGG